MFYRYSILHLQFVLHLLNTTPLLSDGHNWSCLHQHRSEVRIKHRLLWRHLLWHLLLQIDARSSGSDNRRLSLAEKPLDCLAVRTVIELTSQLEETSRDHSWESDAAAAAADLGVAILRGGGGGAAATRDGAGGGSVGDR
jgi:hypothetical protein